MLIRSLNFEIYAAYNQFYLADENSSFETEDIWTDETVEKILAVGEQFVAIGTARYETVPVSVELHDSEPALELEKYSRVNECGLEITSNKLVLEGCMEYSPDAARISIEAGIYRVRVIYRNLESVIDDWEGKDFYILQLWKDEEMRKATTLKN